MLDWWCKFTSASFFYIPLISSFFSPQIKFQLLKGLNRVPGLRFLLIKISNRFSFLISRNVGSILNLWIIYMDTIHSQGKKSTWLVRDPSKNFQIFKEIGKKSLRPIQFDGWWKPPEGSEEEKEIETKKKRKNPSSNSNWPGSWTERFSRSICIFARPSAAAGLSFFFPLKRKDFNFWRKILFQDSFKIVFFRWECISNGKSHRGDFSLSFWHYLADKWPQIQIERGCEPWCISINPLNLRLRRMDLLTGKSGHRHTHTHLALTAEASSIAPCSN